MLGRRRVFILERDENLTVHWADRRRIAQRNVDAAIWKTDIVQDDVDLVIADDLADFGFDARKIHLRLLNSGSRRRPNMQTHLTRIDLRKEIPAQNGNRAAETAIRTPKKAIVNAGRDNVQERLWRYVSRKESNPRSKPRWMAVKGCRQPEAGVESRSDSLCASDVEVIRKLNRTGTSVKDSTRLAISERQTDSESGENRYFAVP